MIRDPVWAFVNPHYEMGKVVNDATVGALAESATKYRRAWLNEPGYALQYNANILWYKCRDVIYRTQTEVVEKFVLWVVQCR
jgi:hypothetical protein